MIHDQSYLKMIGERFEVEGRFVSASPYGSGHINDTFLMKRSAAGMPVDYILQRINNKVFTDPPKLMENIVRVTSHLRSKLSALPDSEPDREALTVIPSRDGRFFYVDEQGNYWRVYVFITGARTYDVCGNVRHAREAAGAIGHFQACLSDLPGGRLHETIPFFHHTPRRFHALERAVESDSRNRCAAARDAVEFCMERRCLATALIALMEDGTLPERIVHNDAKFNNVMIEEATERAVCVIDLDTVMPGCALYDFGDMVRTIAQTAMEDERDLSLAGMDLGVFEALAQGYVGRAGSFLSPAEIQYMPLAGKVITFTIGIRFLTDYLNGDVYFKTQRNDHNLDRARVQLKMLECMERQESAMNDVVRRVL